MSNFNYRTVSPRFWTGHTGKSIRKMGPETQVVALYLLTNQHSNAIGLYYCPLVSLAHEVGIGIDGASKALNSLESVNFSFYDHIEEVVWVPEMARHQIGESLTPNDKRVRWVYKQIEEYRKTSFYNKFWDKYRDSYHLETLSPLVAPPKVKQRDIEAITETETVQNSTENTLLSETGESPQKRPDLAQEVIDLWNEAAKKANLPACRGGERMRQIIRARRRESGWMENFRQALVYVCGSDWTRGQVPFGNPPRTWKADLEWLTRPGQAERYARAVEFRGKAPSSRASGSDQSLLEQLELSTR